MSITTPLKDQEHSKVPNSSYIKTENETVHEEKPATDNPVNPDKPEAS